MFEIFLMVQLVICTVLWWGAVLWTILNWRKAIIFVRQLTSLIDDALFSMD